ncbi:serine/threonine-protein kinase [Kibdelosporangium aridum]|uniref:serine/threonine-protein kinase n=1 Tax=Kibdelosporangium aridum TaxID=2030 RepID=UPI001C8B550C|nr:serine/threonine-protein kinase [Kibdelosporangium aridum]
MRTGDVIEGRYKLEDARGSGSGGVVWTAFDTKLKRTVALKRPHVVASEADRIQFRREAETAAQVHHPNAISVFDTVDADECWLVMEYLSAQSLDRVLAASGPLPPERVARIGMQIASALAAVHARKILHRDVKLGNILVTDDDLAKLTDFGISLWREVTRTDDGKICGTPAYTAPEVANGEPANEASDVFSLGATLFAAVEGIPPFGTGEPYEILERARRGDILPMRKAGPLAPLLSEMLAVRQGRRPTANQVRQRLKEIVGEWEPLSPPVKAFNRIPFWRRPLARVIAAVVLVVAIGAVVFVGLDQPLESRQTPAPSSGLIGDERTADPCALIDTNAWKDFGPTELQPEYGNFNRCDVLVDVGAIKPVDVEVQLVTRKSRPVRGEPFQVVAVPSDRDQCDRTLVVDETYTVRVTAKIPNPPVDLCAIAVVALDTVQSVLRKGPVPRRSVPFPADSLANVDTCQLLDNRALAALPAVDTSMSVNVFGGWACKWYSTTGGPGANLRFDRQPAGERISGDLIPLGGHDAYVKLDTNTSCTVSVPSQPANRNRRTIELMVLTVSGERPGSEYCRTATNLATVAAAKLPR